MVIDDGIKPYNRIQVITFTCLYSTNYYTTFNYTKKNWTDLINVFQSLYLFFITTSVISEYHNYNAYRQKSIYMFAYCEALIEKCKIEKFRFKITKSSNIEIIWRHISTNTMVIEIFMDQSVVFSPIITTSYLKWKKFIHLGYTLGFTISNVVSNKYYSLLSSTHNNEPLNKKQFINSLNKNRLFFFFLFFYRFPFNEQPWPQYIFCYVYFITFSLSGVIIWSTGDALYADLCNYICAFYKCINIEIGYRLVKNL